MCLLCHKRNICTTFRNIKHIRSRMQFFQTFNSIDEKLSVFRLFSTKCIYILPLTYYGYIGKKQVKGHHERNMLKDFDTQM